MDSDFLDLLKSQDVKVKDVDKASEKPTTSTVVSIQPPPISKKTDEAKIIDALQKQGTEDSKPKEKEKKKRKPRKTSEKLKASEINKKLQPYSTSTGRKRGRKEKEKLPIPTPVKKQQMMPTEPITAAAVTQPNTLMGCLKAASAPQQQTAPQQKDVAVVADTTKKAGLTMRAVILKQYSDLTENIARMQKRYDRIKEKVAAIPPDQSSVEGYAELLAVDSLLQLYIRNKQELLDHFAYNMIKDD